MTAIRTLGAVALAGALASGCAGTVASQRQIPVSLPRPATLTGDIHKPAGDGPFPALVLLHGCSGIQPNTLAWAQWLVSQGYVALVLDSFSGRGMKRLCADSSPLTGGARSWDVYAAAEYLAKQPFVDANRLGAVGWSHGGWTVLRAAGLEQVRSEVKLRALIAFYPYCGDTPLYRSSIPMLMLLGAEDNWTPAAPCKLLAEEAQRNGLHVTAVVYPGAHHGFDAANLRQPIIIPDARRGAGATVAHDPKAHDDAEKQVKRFLQAELGR